MKFYMISALALPIIGAAQTTPLAEFRQLCRTGSVAGSTTFVNGVKARYSCDVLASGAAVIDELLLIRLASVLGLAETAAQASSGSTA